MIFSYEDALFLFLKEHSNKPKTVSDHRLGTKRHFKQKATCYCWICGFVSILHCKPSSALIATCFELFVSIRFFTMGGRVEPLQFKCFGLLSFIVLQYSKKY